ncbi:MFS general substrate transporter [Lichtheimia hyalospora FSU 10163]|nr:MFS general substrate transporter [Lichtheimia hyalospora FSU 10163]
MFYQQGMPWGMFSDRIGRRLVIVLGVTGSAISIFLLGISTSVKWIIACSLLFGLLDGSLPALRCFVSEITIHHTNTQRTLAMSALQLGFGVGCAVGPLIGSLLMDPVKQYPEIFSTSSWIKDLLVKYPYMLPCFASSCCSMVAATCTFALLEETAPSHGLKPATYTSQQCHMSHKNVDYKTFDDRTMPTLKEEQTHQKSLRIFRSLRESLTRSVLLAIIIKWFNGFYSLYYQTLFAIWAAWSVHQGGLGFSSSGIGSVLFYAGVWQVFAQLTILPILTKWFTNLRLLRMLLIGLAFSFSLCGMIHCICEMGSNNEGASGNIENKMPWVWISTLVLISLITSLDNMASTVSMVLLNNASSVQPSTLGTVNGCTNLVCGMALAAGPATAGVVWSIAQNTDSIMASLKGVLPWEFIALFAMFPLYISYFMKSHDYEVSRHIDRSVRLNHLALQLNTAFQLEFYISSIAANNTINKEH